MRWTVYLVALVALVVILACGDDDGDSTPTPVDGNVRPTTTASLSTATATATAVVTATESPDITVTATTPTPSPTPLPEGRHLVQPGETLFSIAQRYGVSVEALRAANGLTSDLILAGQVLVIPEDGGQPPPTVAPGQPATVIRTVPTSQPVVALTFDAGADRGFAPAILDFLRDEGVPASFGLTGRWAEENPDLVRRIVQEGHSLINHTYSHQSWTGLSDGLGGLDTEQRRDEVERTEAILRDITGEDARPYFRSPYGDYDESVLRDLGELGYAYNLLWTVDTRGWAGASTEEIVQRTLDGLEPGAVVVLHVGSSSQDGPALSELVRQVRERGYSFVTVEQLLPPGP